MPSYTFLILFFQQTIKPTSNASEIRNSNRKNAQTGYFVFIRDMTLCLDGYNMAGGLRDECPNCGSENVEHLSGVTGYLQDVSGWNAGKKQELKDRMRYKVGRLGRNKGVSRNGKERHKTRNTIRKGKSSSSKPHWLSREI